MKKIILFLLSVSSLSASTWSSTNAQYLYGTNFNHVAGGDSIKDGELQTITLEHSSGWSYGKNFFFVDVSSANYNSGKKHQVYTEFAPKLSLSKTLQRDIGSAFIKDLYLAADLNYGDNFQSTNLGIAVGLDIPSFDFLDVMLYSRDDNFNKANYQITLAWKNSFTLLHQSLVFAGFFDNYGTDNSNIILTQPQLLLEGRSISQSIENTQLGVEFYYYRDSNSKISEFRPQMMLKWIF